MPIETVLAELHRIACDQSLSIACAESVTAGQLQSLLASQSGASAWFAGGMTTYNLDQKVRQLGVDRERAAACNCVSQQVTEQMAEACRERFGVDLTLATTGYAEPSPADGVEQPFAFVAVATSTQTIAKRIDLNRGSRVANQQQAAELAVKLLFNNCVVS